MSAYLAGALKRWEAGKPTYKDLYFTEKLILSKETTHYSRRESRSVFYCILNSKRYTLSVGSHTFLYLVDIIPGYNPTPSQIAESLLLVGIKKFQVVTGVEASLDSAPYITELFYSYMNSGWSWVYRDGAIYYEG